MGKRLVILTLLLAVSLAASNALADSIGNRLGITGRIGFIVPSNNSNIAFSAIGTNTDFIGGGGLIYGITDHIAAEIDITHAGVGSSAGLDFNTTNITLGAQYRFINLPIQHLVPYGGAGLDILINDVNYGSVDNVVAGHVSVGVDYFLMKQLALNAEAKGVLAPNADFKSPVGIKIGEFDPTSFSMVFGIRYFFN